MNNHAEYDEMRAHYRKLKQQAMPKFLSGYDEQQLELLKEVPGLQKDLMEFCLASGGDLEELNSFFREVDSETAPICPG